MNILNIISFLIYQVINSPPENVLLYECFVKKFSTNPLNKGRVWFMWFCAVEGRFGILFLFVFLYTARGKFLHFLSQLTLWRQMLTIWKESRHADTVRFSFFSCCTLSMGTGECSEPNNFPAFCIHHVGAEGCLHKCRFSLFCIHRAGAGECVQ